MPARINRDAAEFENNFTVPALLADGE